MITLVSLAGHNVPRILCDYCRQPIDDAAKAMVLNRLAGTVPEGEHHPVLHVHKGECLNTLESHQDTPCGTMELTTHLYQLGRNSGVSAAALLFEHGIDAGPTD